MRLSGDTLGQVKAGVATPDYDREGTDIGIVHFGPGAFWRAHQCVFTDDAIARSGGDWGISAVSLNSPRARDALAPQDGLYTLAIRDVERSYRVIGAVKEVLFAGDDHEVIVERLCAATTKFVTLTITEKGYALDGSGKLDVNNPMIQADLANPDQPSSAMGYIVLATRLRLSQGLPGLCVVSCDNLPDNGDCLRRACAELAAEMGADTELYNEIRRNMHFPNTMVDSITPATDKGILSDVEDALGLRDDAAIQREAFTQWVIEDDLPKDRPDWAGAGAIITSDVAGYERTKLRILNGAHSSLTYMGLMLGHQTIFEAVSDPVLDGLVDAMIRQEAISTIDAPSGLNLKDYWADTRARFANPHIEHRLEQISHDGSLKIPARILPVIGALGLKARRASLVVATWIVWTRQRRLSGQDPVDKAFFRLPNLPDATLGMDDYALALLTHPQLFGALFIKNVDLRTEVLTLAVTIDRAGLSAVLKEYA